MKECWPKKELSWGGRENAFERESARERLCVLSPRPKQHVKKALPAVISECNSSHEWGNVRWPAAKAGPPTWEREQILQEKLRGHLSMWGREIENMIILVRKLCYIYKVCIPMYIIRSARQSSSKQRIFEFSFPHQTVTFSLPSPSVLV